MSDRMDYVRTLPGFERGHPHYYTEPVIDHLLEIVLQLGAEIWVSRDRQLIIEHLLATRGHVTPEMIEDFEPPENLRQVLNEQRTEFTRRVFGCLYETLENDESGAFVPGAINKKKA